MEKIMIKEESGTKLHFQSLYSPILTRHITSKLRGETREERRATVSPTSATNKLAGHEDPLAYVSISNNLSLSLCLSLPQNSLWHSSSSS